MENAGLKSDRPNDRAGKMVQSTGLSSPSPNVFPALLSGPHFPVLHFRHHPRLAPFLKHPTFVLGAMLVHRRIDAIQVPCDMCFTNSHSSQTRQLVPITGKHAERNKQNAT